MDGKYTVTVTDANNCSAKQSFTFVQPSAKNPVSTGDAISVGVESIMLAGDIGTATCVTEKGIVYATAPMQALTDHKVTGSGMDGLFVVISSALSHIP